MTVRETKEYCKKILEKGNPISLHDKEFLMNLIKHHPHFNEKKGAGITNFYIGKTIFNEPCFFVVRNDESFMPFSYIKCIRHLNSSSFTMIKKACRTIVSQHAPVKTIKDSQFHHAKLTMEKLVQTWIQETNPDLALMPPEHNDIGVQFRNPSTIQSFIQFHKKNGCLVEIDKTSHLLIHSS